LRGFFCPAADTISVAATADLSNANLAGFFFFSAGICEIVESAFFLAAFICTSWPSASVVSFFGFFLAGGTI
jgi:hypothetical protein